jgi:hypothetical protein
MNTDETSFEAHRFLAGRRYVYPMSPGLEHDRPINRFPLPRKNRDQIGDGEVTEYAGLKYLAIPILGDRVEVSIDGRMILKYDGASDGFSECTGIDDTSILFTDAIKCSYRCMGEWNYSC